MKANPTRNPQASRSEARGRMLRKIETSLAGKRVLRECQAALDRPVNSDPDSRKLVFARFAMELDIYTYELQDLLQRKY